MNEANLAHLEGSVRADPRQGDNWTRYRRNARGQVRFWLAVSRDLAGDGCDVLLCAIEPTKVEELTTYERELRGGRTVRLTAAARAIGDQVEDSPGVIFVAEECSFDGAPLHNVHRLPRHAHLHGKSAAAGDRDEAEVELQLEMDR